MTHPNAVGTNVDHIKAVAEELLASVADLFTTPVPNTMVTAGTPAAPLGTGTDCELLTVHLVRTFNAAKGTLQTSEARSCAVVPAAVFAVTLFRCVPTGDASIDAMNTSGLANMVDADTLWYGLCGGGSALWPTTITEPRVRPVELHNVGPQGGFVALVGTIETTL